MGSEYIVYNKNTLNITKSNITRLINACNQKFIGNNKLYLDRNNYFKRQYMEAIMR